MLQITGQLNDFTRVRTGLYSLDNLFANHRGDIGLPGSTVTEWYGPPSIGKSTIVMYLAGKVSAETGGTLLPFADLENAYELGHMRQNLSGSGFTGNAFLVQGLDKKGKARSHEEMLEEIVTSLKQPEVSAIVIDSIGAITPSAEMNNPIGAANMGNRGRVMAQVSRKMLYFLRIADRPKYAFLVNHQYEALGKIGQRVTPGGNAKSYAASIRVTMYAKERFEWEDTHVALRADKLRIGGVRKNDRGYVYIMPNFGVSPEMTAVFDCVVAGHAERTSRGIKMNDKNYGYLRTMREQVLTGDAQWWTDFRDALDTNGFQDTEEDTDGESEA